MTRSEIEDPPAAAFVTAPASEDLAPREPADQDQPIRYRDVEMLAIHLLGVEREALPETFGDRMGRVDDP